MRVLSKTFIKCFPLGSPPKCKGGGLIYESNTNLYEMQSHPGRFLGQHASDNADSNGQRRMEAGRTIMLPNAMMKMPIQMWQSCIIQWLQHKAQVRRLRTRTRSHWIAKYILWATPYAAGPRSLLIASGLQIHFGVLGDPGPILGQR